MPALDSSLETSEGYPQHQRFWDGKEAYCLGSGVYALKFAFINIQIYSVAIYVEREAAAAKARQLKKEGFFKDDSEVHVCSFLNQPGFRKMVHTKLLRSIPTGRFISEMTKDMGPRAAQAGAEESLIEFIDYYKHQEFKKGCSMTSIFDGNDSMSGGIFPPGFDDWEHARPGMSITDGKFCRALLSSYIDEHSVTKSVRKIWAQSILDLPHLK